MIMAEKNKKRGGRRAHLNDFHVNLAGDYVYTGAHYTYVDQGRSRDRVQRELWGLSIAILLAVVAGGAWLLWRYMLTLKWEKLPARDLDEPQA